jgi:glycosyltransferase involved in cell wall biosynthesis
MLPTLRTHDRVVIAAHDEPAVSKTFAGARQISVVAHPRHAMSGLVASLAQDHDGPVVLVDGHVLTLDKHWLDRLVAKLDSADLSSPISNGAPAPQCPTEGPGLVTDRDEIRSVARRVASYDGPTELVDRVLGPVVAMTAHIARQLPQRCVDGQPKTVANAAIVMGATAVLDRSVYVHANRNLPLISQCMIMKNETEFLASCIGSGDGLVDETVIYDTGSDDGSVALARCLGASVIEGYWDSSFGRARNASLEWCRGEFVMACDPDDLLDRDTTDSPATRNYLAARPHIDSVAAPIVCLSGSRASWVDSGFSFPAGRFMHRLRMHWSGGLHEQAMRRDGSPGNHVLLDSPVFFHRGYLVDVVADRNKQERNLKAIETDDDVTDDDGRHRFDRARTLSALGRNDEAMELMAWVVEHSKNEFFVRAGLEALWGVAVAAGDIAESRRRIDELDRISPLRNIVKLLNAQQLGLEERFEEGLAALDGWQLENDRFTAHTPEEGLLIRAKLLFKLDRLDEANDVLVDAVTTNPIFQAGWEMLLSIGLVTDEQLARAAATARATHLGAICSFVGAASTDMADRVLEAIYCAHPDAHITLAAASQVAMHVPIDRAVVWSDRLRALHLFSHCPLVAIGLSEQVDVERRAAALAAAVEQFDDQRAIDGLRALLGSATDESRPAITEQISRFRHTAAALA